LSAEGKIRNHLNMYGNKFKMKKKTHQICGIVAFFFVDSISRHQEQNGLYASTFGIGDLKKSFFDKYNTII